MRDEECLDRMRVRRRRTVRAMPGRAPRRWVDRGHGALPEVVAENAYGWSIADDPDNLGQLWHRERLSQGMRYSCGFTWEWFPSRMRPMAESGAPTESGAAAVYQLRVVVAGVSPLIWRRLLATATIAELHAVLRAAFGWSGQHLHRFVIHGRGTASATSADQVSATTPTGRADRLGPADHRAVRLSLRLHRRLAPGVRVENIMAAEADRSYPRCTGGRRAGPVEGCGGA